MQTKAGSLKVRAKIAGLSPEEYSDRETSGLKFCARCNTWKSRLEYQGDKSRHDGLKNYCSACFSKHTGSPGVRERREQRKAGLSWCKDCRLWLPSEAVSNGRCREHNRVFDRFRYSLDPLYRIERRQHARSRKRKTAKIPPHYYTWLFDHFAGKCAYCGKTATTIDHIIPISKGGQTEPANLLPACVSCNSSKKDTDFDLWVEQNNISLPEAALDILSLPYARTR